MTSSCSICECDVRADQSHDPPTDSVDSAENRIDAVGTRASHLHKTVLFSPANKTGGIGSPTCPQFLSWLFPLHARVSNKTSRRSCACLALDRHRRRQSQAFSSTPTPGFAKRQPASWYHKRIGGRLASLRTWELLGPSQTPDRGMHPCEAGKGLLAPKARPKPGIERKLAVRHALDRVCHPMSLRLRG